jgi:hypothetical protein
MSQQETLAEASLQPRHAGSAHPQQGRRLLQGSLSQGGKQDGLGGAQLAYVAGLGDQGSRFGNEFRMDSTRSGHDSIVPQFVSS